MSQDLPYATYPGTIVCRRCEGSNTKFAQHCRHCRALLDDDCTVLSYHNDALYLVGGRNLLEDRLDPAGWQCCGCGNFNMDEDGYSEPWKCRLASHRKHQQFGTRKLLQCHSVEFCPGCYVVSTYGDRLTLMGDADDNAGARIKGGPLDLHLNYFIKKFRRARSGNASAVQIDAAANELEESKESVVIIQDWVKRMWLARDTGVVEQHTIIYTTIQDDDDNTSLDQENLNERAPLFLTKELSPQKDSTPVEFKLPVHKEGIGQAEGSDKVVPIVTQVLEIPDSRPREPDVVMSDTPIRRLSLASTENVATDSERDFMSTSTAPTEPDVAVPVDPPIEQRDIEMTAAPPIAPDIVTAETLARQDVTNVASTKHDLIDDAADVALPPELEAGNENESAAQNDGVNSDCATPTKPEEVATPAAFSPVIEPEVVMNKTVSAEEDVGENLESSMSTNHEVAGALVELDIDMAQNATIEEEVSMEPVATVAKEMVKIISEPVTQLISPTEELSASQLGKIGSDEGEREQAVDSDDLTVDEDWTKERPEVAAPTKDQPISPFKEPLETTMDSDQAVYLYKASSPKQENEVSMKLKNEQKESPYLGSASELWTSMSEKEGYAFTPSASEVVKARRQKRIPSPFTLPTSRRKGSPSTSRPNSRPSTASTMKPSDLRKEDTPQEEMILDCIVVGGFRDSSDSQDQDSEMEDV